MGQESRPGGPAGNAVSHRGGELWLRSRGDGETEPPAHSYFELRFLNFVWSFDSWHHQSVRLQPTRQQVGHGLLDTSLPHLLPLSKGKGSRIKLKY